MIAKYIRNHFLAVGQDREALYPGGRVEVTAHGVGGRFMRQAYEKASVYEDQNIA